MVNILVSVRADLASSIAIRYAGQLSKYMEIGLQPIHVKEPETKESLLGTGWVRHTWENALTEKGMEEINQLIRIEKPNCPALAAPRVLVGERDEEILRELQMGNYDLFMEGVLATFNIADFQKLLKSKLYQNLPCPVIMVKNLVSIEKFAFLTFEGIDSEEVATKFLQVFRETSPSIDIIHFKPEKSPELEVTEDEISDASVDSARKVFDNAGIENTRMLLAAGPPQEMSEYLGSYALVVSSAKDGLAKKKNLLTVLARTPSPVFLA